VGMPKVHDLWATRTRVSIAVATLSWFLVAPLAQFTAAGGGQRVVSLRGPVKPNAVPLFTTFQYRITDKAHYVVATPTLNQSVHVISYASFAIGMAFMIGLFALAVGWLRLLHGIRATSTTHRRRTLFLAWTPAVALLAYVALWFAFASQQASNWIEQNGAPPVPLNGNPTAAHALHVALVVVGLSGWILSIVAIAIAVKQADLALIDLQYGKRLSFFMAAVTSLMFVAYVILAIALYTQPAASFSGLTVVSDHQALLLPIMVALGCSSLTTIMAAGSARRSWRVIASPI
jgi:hypothetical protein